MGVFTVCVYMCVFFCRVCRWMWVCSHGCVCDAQVLYEGKCNGRGMGLSSRILAHTPKGHLASSYRKGSTHLCTVPFIQEG